MTDKAIDPTVEGFRLSPQQRHTWHLLTHGPASAFTIQCAVGLPADVDAGRLERALHSVVARFEILRTTFRCLPGMTLPVQVIDPAVTSSDVALSYESWSSDSSVDALFAAEAQRPLDLAVGPVLRAVVVSGADTLLVLTLPALCADAVGIVNLVRELARDYAGAEPDAEPMQYADLAEWQNEMLAEADADQVPTFPLERLRLELPMAGPVSNGYVPGMVRRTLDPGVVGQIEQVVASGASVPGFFVACWQAVLRRLSGQDEMVIGVAGDGRTFEGLDTALGPFTRDLPLHATLAAVQPFAALLADTERALADLHDAQEYFAWERLPERADLPGFLVGFAFEERDAVVEVEGARFAIHALRAGTQQCAMRLVVARTAGGMAVELHHDGARFDEPDAAAVLDGFVTAAAAAAAAPETAIDDLELLDEATRRRVLVDFNPTPVEVDTDLCVHRLIEAHADAVPDAPAILGRSGTVSWGELETRANRLAHHLRALGVQPDQLVGLCVERGPDMVVGIVGILKAGAAYLPLDPGYPADRLAFMLQDTRAPVLLTQQHLLERLPAHDARIVCFDRDAAEIAVCSAARPDHVANADHLAYVIYTSGSTGKPKGVELTHRTLVHSTKAREDTYDAAPGRYLLLSSFAFDSSVAGIFWSLCAGGALVLPGEGQERDLHEITALIQGHGVTHTLALPSLYALLLRETRPEQLASLRCVIVAGEACPGELVGLHFERLPGAALFNEYGPTEATVWSSVHRCEPADATGKVPIGRPIRNAVVRLLDPKGRPVPPGVPGEMFLGGPGLARGYLGRPELTAERFVRNPLGDGLLYRTGDLARYRSDGVIDFLGRVDHQVKIRGYRIELEEIEDVLRRQDGIQDVAVAAREDTPGDQRLVGYVVAAAGAVPESMALQDALRASLPDYMVPAVFMVLHELPLMPNGKVDRKALPAPDASGAAARPDYTAPRNAVEEVLAEIWSDVLGADDIGVGDNFFLLGGHSLLVTQLVFRVRDNLGVELPLRAVFEAPTLGQLTDMLLADPARRDSAEKAAALLGQLADMSEDEIDSMLEQNTPDAS